MAWKYTAVSIRESFENIPGGRHPYPSHWAGRDFRRSIAPPWKKGKWRYRIWKGGPTHRQGISGHVRDVLSIGAAAWKRRQSTRFGGGSGHRRCYSPGKRQG